MSEEQTMNLYEALREMRKATTPFSVEFITYSRDRKTGGKRIFIENALCASQQENVLEDKLQGFKKVDNPDEPVRRCYIYSILKYNGKTLIE
jgi:hypothetical protein